MNSSMNYNNQIVDILKNHATLFDSFEHVYLFGSAQYSNVIANDVDILLIYRNYTPIVSDALKELRVILEKVLEIPVDLTALSIEEEKDIAFLKKIHFHCIEIK